MDGNPLINPVGSLPPQVYWRRRAMTGLVVLLVVWFAWSNVKGGAKAAGNAATTGNAASAGSAAKTGKTTTAGLGASPAPSTTPAATVTTPATPATGAPATTAVAATVTSPAPTTTVALSTAPAAPVVAKCTSASLRLTVTADHTVYAKGALPHFVLTVTNVGPATCLVDVGTTNRGFVVTSGSDRIWSSADCAKTSPNVQAFKPKDSVGYAHDWGRLRSTPTGCSAVAGAALPGTYRVVAHLGDLTAGPAVFRLT